MDRYMDLPEIPINKDLTYLGITTYRDKNQLFGIKRRDRRQHVYILGKSGTGKSILMFNMIIQNIRNGDGVCMVDPHGENVEAVLSAIPPERMKDVVYFNPADTEYHMGFNVLELIDPQYKHLVASGLMGIFTKIWANAWSARMEYILNNAILALLDTPGTTLLGIPRMLVDKDYRQKIIGNLKDPVIKAFWVHEYEAWQDKFRNEAIAPIQNKVGQFLSTSIIRNVVGQSKSTINIFDMMNEGKIFLVNVSKGRIGEDNSGLLGGMIITKIQLAAMERVRIPEESRKDFYLFVDEFQNFVTDAFASILSEARKYRLNLTVAHQYTAQLVVDKSSAVRDAVFGNVGTTIIFRVGADDAEFLESEFEPEFTPQDIVNLPNYKVYLKLMIDGVTSRPFSSRTLPALVKSGNKAVEEEVIRSSRALYCIKREIVEREINNWSGMALGDDGAPSGLGTGNLEKFPAICSLCKKETTVPFKPDPGRAVYCKDCVAKIKSGEVKVEKNSENQIRHDETTFFKPLADLGIEFQPKENDHSNSEFPKNKAPERYPDRPDRNLNKSSASSGKPSILNSIKKVFTPSNGGQKRVSATNRMLSSSFVKPKPLRVAPENKALKEVLNKIVAQPAEVKPQPKVEVPIPTPAISLDVLKIPPPQAIKKMVPNSKDRAASAEDMNKLKDLITEKTQTAQMGRSEPLPNTTTPPVGTPPPQGGDEIPKNSVKASPVGVQPREVPEDVLRKVLE